MGDARGDVLEGVFSKDKCFEVAGDGAEMRELEEKLAARSAFT